LPVQRSKARGKAIGCVDPTTWAASFTDTFPSLRE